jgi:hypothetical protein
VRVVWRTVLLRPWNDAKSCLPVSIAAAARIAARSRRPGACQTNQRSKGDETGIVEIR